MKPSRIKELSTIIDRSADRIQAYLEAHDLPNPSFHPDAVSLPAEMADAQDVILHATAELNDLLMEPVNALHRSGNVRLLHS